MMEMQKWENNDNQLTNGGMRKSIGRKMFVILQKLAQSSISAQYLTTWKENLKNIKFYRA